MFLKLQKRVTELEQEKQILQDELDRKEEQVFRSKAKVSNSEGGRAAHSVVPEFLGWAALTRASKALTVHCPLYSS